MGIVLYCLLTGTLPFDDDDEAVMRSKIIQGDFEDSVWLSLGEVFFFNESAYPSTRRCYATSKV